MLWLSLPVLFLLSWSLTEFFRRSALKTNLLAIPNHRSSHSVPTPTSGGIGFVICFLLCIVFAITLRTDFLSGLFAMALGAAGIAIIGFIDDSRQVRARYRLVVHILAAVGLLATLPTLPVIIIPFGVLDSVPFLGLFYFLGLVWLLNLYNFMDGIDGIAGVEALTVASSAAVLLAMNGDYQWSWLLSSLAACVAGFLVLNWPPAKIFMGDVGSGFIGYVLGGLAILTATHTDLPIWCWLILLAFFISDASITLFRRALKGTRIYEAHRSHAYQILARRWLSHAKVSGLVAAINVFWLFPFALLANSHSDYGILFAIVSYLPIGIFIFKTGAGTTNS